MSEGKWQAYASGLWCADYKFGNISVRSTAVRLADGSLLIISPGASLAGSSHSFLGQAGQPSWLLAPNHFHHAGLNAWRQYFPELKLACGKAAHRRLSSKGYASLSCLEDLRPALNENTQVLELPGSRTGECLVIVSCDGGHVWLVCDAFFNIDQMPRSLPMRLVMRAFDMAPGLKVGRQFRYLFIQRWQEYRSWLTGLLESYPPTLLIPSHGQVLADVALKNRLIQAVS